MGPTGIPTGSPTAQLQAFAQSVYKLIKNRYYSDLTTVDGQNFLSMVVDWVNEYIDELEYEITSDGDPIDWIWVRSVMVNLGMATINTSSITFDTGTYRKPVSGQDRYIQVLNSSGQALSNFAVVSIDDISNDTRKNTDDMVANVNGTLYFSRPFRNYEDGGTIVGDMTGYLPRVQTNLNSQGAIIATNTSVFSTVKPFTLLKLGTTKNAILPDIVMGGLNPSYTQKYNDLLTNAINHSMASAVSPTADYENYEGQVHGVGF